MYGTIWALLPPVVAIVLALITKEVYSSLFIGIVTGALIYTGFSPIATLDTVINEGFINSVADAWNIGIFMFLILLGTMVALMNKAGGSAAFGEWAKKHVKTRAGALLATFLLGVLIFVDDYFNCLTVGSVMMPVTDGHKISRAKLAYIIDATAAPICMIAPISSWAAAVSGMVDEGVYSGIERRLVVEHPQVAADERHGHADLVVEPPGRKVVAQSKFTQADVGHAVNVV